MDVVITVKESGLVQWIIEGMEVVIWFTKDSCLSCRLSRNKGVTSKHVLIGSFYLQTLVGFNDVEDRNGYLD